MLQRQIDFRLEAANLECFRKSFDGDPLVAFPSVSFVSDAELLQHQAGPLKSFRRLSGFGPISRRYITLSHHPDPAGAAAADRLPAGGSEPRVLPEELRRRPSRRLPLCLVS